MARSIWSALRISKFQRKTLQTAKRRRLRLSIEMLERRELLHGGANTDAGTLADEHTAVMELINFAEIHSPIDEHGEAKPGFSATPYYYQAQDSDRDPSTPNYWSDPANWIKLTFDSATGTFLPPVCPPPSNGLVLPCPTTDHIPSTGDDVEVPVNVSMVYDIAPEAFTKAPPTPEGVAIAPPPTTLSVKNNLRLHTVGVLGGLEFKPNSNLLMYFETMIVGQKGSMTMNETDASKSVRLVIGAPDWTKFSLAQPFDTELDPFEFSRGLISHGKVDIDGEDVTPFVTLPDLKMSVSNLALDPNNIPTPTVTTIVNGKSKTVAATKNAFQFTIPAGIQGWSIGDRIVVTGTDPNKINSASGASGDEEALIVRIVPNTDGSATVYAKTEISELKNGSPIPVVTPKGPLQYDHVPAIDSSGKSLGIQVANLSRNINVQSEDPYHTMARGHVMFMHNADVHVEGVGFLDLGRSDKRTVVDDVQFYTKEIIDALNQAGTLHDPNYELEGEVIPGTGLNPRGRYAMHFHRAGINETDAVDPNHPQLKDGGPAEVEDSVVVDSPGWGFVSHTSYVNFDNNVAFNVVGASFVTEVGNELGRFTGNLAVKGVGANTGEGIESRKVKQDFGFQGDGFWFQGPMIQVENNIAASQKHDGFVFFTEALVQNYSWVGADGKLVTSRQEGRTTTDIMSKFYDAALIAAFGGPGQSVDPGNVPILGFKNNTSVGNGVGMETWFHQLGSPLNGNDPAHRALGSQIVGLKVGNTRGTAMFDPYTNLTTVKDSELIGNVSSPSGTGMSRNDVTANFTYSNVTIRGFSLGIAIPVNGLDIVTGGTFQNKRNLEITTANSRTRTVMLVDKKENSVVVSPLTFLPLTKEADETARINVDLRTSYDPKQRDLSKLFNPDIIRMGTVWLDSFALGSKLGEGLKQLYYYQQAADFVPFPANDASGNPINYGGPVYDNATFKNIVDYSGIEVPKELLGQNNEALMASFGLSIGGTVAPSAALGTVDGRSTFDFVNPDSSIVKASPRINGLIGPTSEYQLSLDATSARYTKNTDPAGTSPAYTFSYRYSKPLTSGAGDGTTVNVTVKVGNFVPESGYAVQLKKLSVNAVAVTVLTAANAPIKPTEPAPAVLQTAPTGVTLTSTQAKALKTTNDNITKAYTAALSKYKTDLKAYNTWWSNYYNTPVKLSLREGWNVVTGDLDGTGQLRTQLIYGDTQTPDLNLTSPDKNQLRRLTASADPWTAGTWDATPTTIVGVPLGSTDLTPRPVEVRGQFVAVMNPNDISFGFNLKGNVVDNSFGKKSFELFIGNLKSFLVPNTSAGAAAGSVVPLLTPPTDALGNALPNYGNIADYQSFKDGTNATLLNQRLQTIFFAVKDLAGNSKTFALTIYIDATAPRVGGSANPSGSVAPSASMIALANQAYIIDLETFLMIDSTKKK